MKDFLILSYDYKNHDIEEICNIYRHIEQKIQELYPNIAVVALPNDFALFEDSSLTSVKRLKNKLDKIIELKEQERTNNED